MAAIRPTARVAHLGPAALTVALGAVPMVVAVARGSTDLSWPLIVAGIAGGASLGWGTEDAAADLLAAMPVSGTVRSTMRVSFVAVVVAVGAASTLGVASFGRGAFPTLDLRVPEAAAAAGIALAFGFTATRRRIRGAGAASITVGVTAPGVVAALSFRWPRVLPSFLESPAHDRWWVIAVIGALTAAWGARDFGRH